VGDVFRALADPTRRAILDELTERDGQTLFEICGRLAARHGLASTRQAISQHLDVLEEAGLVRTRRQGRYKFHDIDMRPLATAVARWLHPQDAGRRDTGARNTGPRDTGPAQTGPRVAGSGDTRPSDTGPRETGPAHNGRAGTE
jgi:DNA-binding transcriptional ArsR family regulator